MSKDRLFETYNTLKKLAPLVREIGMSGKTTV